AALGLAAWTPAGVYRWSLELIAVGTGLPWFWVTIGGVVLWRVIVLPSSISGQRRAATLQMLQPKLKPIQDEIEGAKARGDTLALQIAAAKARSLMSKHNVDPLMSFVQLLIQIPVMLGTFLGARTLFDTSLEPLKHSGVSFMPDLTATDPWGILPIA
ncbi:hypothetical protein FISHEDRAFT_28736, partial [Fistulina hepatica ATCC 64428]